MEKEIPFTGILSNKAEENPGLHSIDLFNLERSYCVFFFLALSALLMLLFLMLADFFNWNRVKLRYCDGASFAGDNEDQVEFYLGALEMKIISTLVARRITKVFALQIWYNV